MQGAVYVVAHPARLAPETRLARRSNEMSTQTARTRAVGYVAGITMVLAPGCGSDNPATDTPPPDVSAAVPATDSTTQPTGTTRLYVKSERVDCIGEAPQQCLQVVRSEDGPYELFYDQIEGGFEFEEGTSYVLDAEVTEVDNPPAMPPRSPTASSRSSSARENRPYATACVPADHRRRSCG